MNKKVMTTFVIAGTTLVLGGLMSSAFAQDTDTTEVRKEGRPFMQHMMQNKGNFKMMKHKDGNFMKPFMNQLDETTQAKVKALHKAHKTQVDALKDQFGDDKEGFINAMKDLQATHKAELQAILPANVVAQMQEREKEFGEGFKGPRMEGKGEFLKGIMDNLDEATQAKVKALHEAHKTQVDALKAQFGDDKEGFINAMKDLHSTHKAELEAILPADVVAQMKEHEADHQDKMMTRGQEKKEVVKTKYQQQVKALSTKIEKATEHLSPEKMQTVLTSLISKLQDKSAKLKAKADTTNNDTIALIDALIVDLQSSLQ